MSELSKKARRPCRRAYCAFLAQSSRFEELEKDEPNRAGRRACLPHKNSKKRENPQSGIPTAQPAGISEQLQGETERPRREGQ